MENENNKTQELDLSDEQQRVAEALVFSGVSFERDRLTKILSPHIGKAINVDTMIDIINNIPLPEQPEENKEDDVQV